MPEDLSKSFVTGPLTMLSEEEEMMKDTGKLLFCRSQFENPNI